MNQWNEKKSVKTFECPAWDEKGQKRYSNAMEVLGVGSF
jgi:hypothetical protein